jgi:catechol 2,3-dioxygenase-like lactoylglutathione lyase family enzyme
VPTRAPAITVAGYSHVAIMVDDLDAALAFYCDALGFSVLPRPDFGPGTAGAWLQLGTAQVHLGTVDAMAPSAGFPHLALHIPAASWDDTMAAIEERGIEFLLPPSERLDFGKPVRAAFIRDPAGNVIELTDVDPT